MIHDAPPLLRRRTLLGAGAAGLLGLTSCSPPLTEARVTNATERLVARRPFYIAFRAGARDWPEMSGYAFDQAAALEELQAVELSVCRTADGVLVCSYDTNTQRLTNLPYEISKYPWSALKGLELTSAETLDPQQPRRRFARLDDVLSAHLSRFVFFIEPRTAEAETNLMATLIGMDQPDRLVWKQPIVSHRFAKARSHGFATWGYVLREKAHLGENLKRLAASPDITMLGVSGKHPDSVMRDVSAVSKDLQKPAIAWNIFGYRHLRRALALGFTGIATPDITKIMRLAPAVESEPAATR